MSANGEVEKTGDKKHLKLNINMKVKDKWWEGGESWDNWWDAGEDGYVADDGNSLDLAESNNKNWYPMNFPKNNNDKGGKKGKGKNNNKNKGGWGKQNNNFVPGKGWGKNNNSNYN